MGPSPLSGSPESLPSPRRAQPWLPAPGWQEINLTFLKPGQVEGAGDVDGGAGAAVGPAGVHVKGPVTEQPFQGRDRENQWSDAGGTDCPSTSEGADATLK